MGKPLTAELVLTRSKSEKLESVKNLNLWGNEIDDVRILREMPNVEVLSLSVNKISSLRDFRHCLKLTELYLRKNMISDLTEIRYLQNLPNLRVLWLWDNPCTEHSQYRNFVIKHLPNLVKLDNQAVSSEERNAALDQGEVPQPRRESPHRPAEPKRKNRRPREGDPRNENILCAVLALLKELDESGLELVKRDIDRKLSTKR